MSLKDEFILKYFTLLTRLDLKIIKGYEDEMKSGVNPRDYKMKLAREMVRFYHSEKEADEAQDFFVNTFSKKEIPDDVPEFKPTTYNLMTLLLESKSVTSKSDAKRVLEQKGVKVNGEVVDSSEYVVKKGDIIQKGKKTFVKVA